MFTQSLQRPDSTSARRCSVPSRVRRRMELEPTSTERRFNVRRSHPCHISRPALSKVASMSRISRPGQRHGFTEIFGVGGDPDPVGPSSAVYLMLYLFAAVSLRATFGFPAYPDHHSVIPDARWMKHGWPNIADP